MDRYVSIGKAAKALGVSISTLRRWEQEGKIKPIPRRNDIEHRRYDLSKIKPELSRTLSKNQTTIVYARVSSRDQAQDLKRQIELLELYCASQGWSYEVMSDLGSGMNYYKKGLKRLLNEMLAGNIHRLVITHKDRLLRFGAELIFAICEAKEVEVIILNKGEEGRFEEELAKDVLEIITVFSARLYGSRSLKNQKLLENMKRVVDDAART
jgi:predicted site-specific integrase-resolvase